MWAALISYGPAWALYGGAAALALWLTWGDASVRMVAVALVTSFIVSNAMWLCGPVAHRPGVYSALQVCVATRSWLAWLELGHSEGRDRTSDRRALVGVVALAVAYICVNLAFSLVYRRAPGQLRAYEVTTNIIYLCECLAVVGIGVADAFRSGRLPGWARLRGRTSQPHAPREREAD